MGGNSFSATASCCVKIIISLLTAAINANIDVMSGRFNKFHAILQIANIVSNYSIWLHVILKLPSSFAIHPFQCRIYALSSITFSTLLWGFLAIGV
jgi:hypothetical protein